MGGGKFLGRETGEDTFSRGGKKKFERIPSWSSPSKEPRYTGLKKGQNVETFSEPQKGGFAEKKKLQNKGLCK